MHSNGHECGRCRNSAVVTFYGIAYCLLCGHSIGDNGRLPPVAIQECISSKRLRPTAKMSRILMQAV